MRYYRFTTAEHARIGIEGEMTAYYEVADDDSFVRSLELYCDGIAYSYDLEHAADGTGILPDVPMDVAAAAEFGTVVEIPVDEFERMWCNTKVANR